MSSNGIGDGSQSPYRDVSEATRCECGHRWDQHVEAEDGGCMATVGGALAERLEDPDICDCRRFQPAEPELDGITLSQAVDRLRERDW